MSQRNLYIGLGALALVLVVLIAGMTAYRVKFKRMEADWQTEQSQRLTAESQLAETRTQLGSTQEELGAVKREAELYRSASAKKDEFLEQTQMRLQELEQEKQKVAAQSQQLRESLQKEIEAKEVEISELRGKLTVNLMDKVLFDSGKAELRTDGKRVLQKVAQFLNQYPDRQIRVEGHTDSLPISAALRKRFPTNWELSTARATAAVRYLQDYSGVAPSRLAGVGYAQYHPLDTNDTPEGRSRNRRIEIVLLPPEPEIRAEGDVLPAP